MTNEQKYKTVDEREKAFFEFCNKQQCAECRFREIVHTRAECPIVWLDDEYKEPEQDLPFKIELWADGYCQVCIALGIDCEIQHFKDENDAVSFCNKLNAAALAWHKRTMEKEGK